MVAQHQSQRHAQTRTLLKWFKKYQITSSERRQEEARKNVIADTYAQRYIPKRFLRQWKAFVLVQKEEKWREYRKECLRNSVKGLLSHSSFEHQLQHSTLSLHDLSSACE